MDYNTLVQSFLKTYSKETSIKVYNKKISFFIQFLVSEKDLTSNNYKELLKSLNEEDFLNGLKRFIEKSEVEYQVTADNFITVITQFFRFLSLEYDIKNTLMIDDTKLGLFKEKADHIIHKLKPGESKEPISDEMFDYVRKGCDKIIDEYTSYSYKGFRAYCSALIVKLTLFLGFKPQELIN